MDIVTEVAGKVWKLVARPGEQLAADDPILILESMKVEIPVAAPQSGRLLEIRVREGDAVSEGEVVAVMD